MRSAKLFLPFSMSLFMKRVRVRLPNLGSGGTSLLTTRARLGMDSPGGRTSLVFKRYRGPPRLRGVRADTDFGVAQRPIPAPVSGAGSKCGDPRWARRGKHV